MIFLLDTNVCVQYLTKRNEKVVSRVIAESRRITLCSIVKAELLAGAHKSAKPTENLRVFSSFFSVLPSVDFDDAAAEHYGRIRTQLERAGTPIGPNDLLIASIALANNLTLVTHNTREFGRINGLKIEDWE
ncbi:tRNA(fMet)-specific endonuclease VapC [Abditibacteriota bacterium]|nr:tRNA(fMet)-specific endonuclease VapC [Abditibacteriota bacterium]